MPLRMKFSVGTPPCPVDQARIARSGIGGEQLLDLDSVLPAVAHVVDVGEALDATVGKIVETDAAGADGARQTESSTVHAGAGDGLAADLELKEMFIVPAHRCLDHGVQFPQGQA